MGAPATGDDVGRVQPPGTVVVEAAGVMTVVVHLSVAVQVEVPDDHVEMTGTVVVYAVVGAGPVDEADDAELLAEDEVLLETGDASDPSDALPEPEPELSDPDPALDVFLDLAAVEVLFADAELVFPFFAMEEDALLLVNLEPRAEEELSLSLPLPLPLSLASELSESLYLCATMTRLAATCLAMWEAA